MTVERPSLRRLIEQRWLTTPRRIFFMVFGLLAVVYAATATWAMPYHGDAFTNAVTAWHIGDKGTVIANDYAELTSEDQRGNFAWFVASPRGPVSQYPPGAALTAAPFYSVFPTAPTWAAMWGNNRPDLPPVELPVPPVWPATLSAVLVTSLACAFLALTFLELGATSYVAALAGVVSGTATTAWSVAANMSWTHGPAMLAISLGVFAASKNRWLLSGIALGFGILTRPHVAVIAAAIGVWTSIARKSWQPLIQVGLGSACGLTALLGYNYWLWSQMTISGGYGDHFTSQFMNASTSWFLKNVVGALFDLSHGLVPWAPFLAVLVWGGIAARAKAPDWTIGVAIGGALYLLFQLRANRFSGGDGHLAYRYPLEALTAAAPWLMCAYQNWVAGRPLARRTFRLLTLTAVAGQLIAGILT